MELLLKREYLSTDYTIGHIYYHGRKVCDTLEPPTFVFEKGAKKSKVLEAKRCFGNISIPPGTYPVIISRSPKFKQWLPLLLNVPGFSDIRIHPGNFPTDTRGCILPGWNLKKGQVLGSKEATKEVVNILTELISKGGKAVIRIENP